MSRFPTYRLDGRTAIVTGASSGIGSATAEAMGEAGARLVLVGRDGERLGRCAASVRDAGGEAAVCAVDLTGEGASDRVVEVALEAFGTVDVLVNAAAIWEPQPFLEAPLESARPPVGNQRAGALRPRAGRRSRTCARAARSSSSPRSPATSGFPGLRRLLHDEGCRRAVHEGARLELSPLGIRVNCVAPGNIRTAMNAAVLAVPEYERGMIEETPLRRIGSVEEVAPAIVFLASEAAAFVQGSTWLVDGGWTAR